MDMRRSLGELLDAAAGGERIRIERDRRPLAYLVPIEDGERLSEVRDTIRANRLQALDDIIEFAARMRDLYPRDPNAPDAASAIRADRDRDEPRR